jgi:hypothetical protein
MYINHLSSYIYIYIYIYIHIYIYVTHIYIYIYMLNVLLTFYSTALVFCRDSGTEIFVRDYDTPLISAPEDAAAEPLLDTRPENSEEV